MKYSRGSQGSSRTFANFFLSLKLATKFLAHVFSSNSGCKCSSQLIIQTSRSNRLYPNYQAVRIISQRSKCTSKPTFVGGIHKWNWRSHWFPFVYTLHLLLLIQCYCITVYFYVIFIESRYINGRRGISRPVLHSCVTHFHLYWWPHKLLQLLCCPWYL